MSPPVTTAPPVPVTVKAHRGDAKTLIAVDLPVEQTKDLAGFTIQVEPPGVPAYYLYNNLQFETPADHAQVASEPPNSSVNAPIHKFRWLHVPGSAHQGLDPVFGTYTYTVTPRYFDANASLLPLDPNLSVSTPVDVLPFSKGDVELGFTRGYTQSQAFVRHFGVDAKIRPAGHDLIFDTKQVSGKDADGNEYTYDQEYSWLGFTARQRVFEILNEVLDDNSLRLDVFAYDLNEPDFVQALLELAKQGRVRVILDNAALHHSTTSPKPEDVFETDFGQAATGDAAIKRGKFGRYSHDKIMIVSDAAGPRKVLTGSTNFSVTGFYVNSNHVIVFADSRITGEYATLFDTVWQHGPHEAAFLASPLSQDTVEFDATADTPKTEITFSPHTEAFATTVLDGISQRVATEGTTDGGSVLFAVMELDNGTSPVYTALNALHANQEIFSYGISDNPDGIYLYEPGKTTGVLVTGKPVRTRLPAPFNQVPGVGAGHQIHHKFVVCGFNGSDPVVYCGSSNLALGGEQLNGDNLLAIHDGDVATAFALEALALVDHFQFLDRFADPAKEPPAQPQQTAQASHWFLSTSDGWAKKYYDPADLHYVDRKLFVKGA